MSRYDYERSRDVVALDVPFAALIMAAMRQADTGNHAALGYAFPSIAIELERRYNAPAGVLADDGDEGVTALARTIDPAAFDVQEPVTEVIEERREHARRSARDILTERG